MGSIIFVASSSLWAQTAPTELFNAMRDHWFNSEDLNLEMIGPSAADFTLFMQSPNQQPAPLDIIVQSGRCSVANANGNATCSTTNDSLRIDATNPYNRAVGYTLDIRVSDPKTVVGNFRFAGVSNAAQIIFHRERSVSNEQLRQEKQAGAANEAEMMNQVKNRAAAGRAADDAAIANNLQHDYQPSVVSPGADVGPATVFAYCVAKSIPGYPAFFSDIFPVARGRINLANEEAGFRASLDLNYNGYKGFPSCATRSTRGEAIAARDWLAADARSHSTVVITSWRYDR